VQALVIQDHSFMKNKKKIKGCRTKIPLGNRGGNQVAKKRQKTKKDVLKGKMTLAGNRLDKKRKARKPKKTKKKNGENVGAFGPDEKGIKKDFINKKKRNLTYRNKKTQPKFGGVGNLSKKEGEVKGTVRPDEERMILEGRGKKFFERRKGSELKKEKKPLRGTGNERRGKVTQKRREEKNIWTEEKDLRAREGTQPKAHGK